MPSTITSVVAARVPNHVADRIRQEAETTGDTVSAVAGRLLQQAIAASRAPQLKGNE